MHPVAPDSHNGEVSLFTYTLDDDDDKDLTARVEEERTARGINEADWKEIVVARWEGSKELDLAGDIWPFQFPVVVSLRVVSTVSESTRQAIAALEEADALRRVAEYEEADALRQVTEYEEEYARRCVEDGTAELQHTARHSLAAVVRCLIGVLSGDDGVDKLMLSCPIDLHEQAQMTLRGMIGAWLGNFRRTAAALSADAPDSAIMQSLATTLRGIMQLVALVNPTATQEQISMLTKEWILTALVNISGNPACVAGINTDRLHDMLRVASHTDEPIPENLLEALRSFGCKEDALNHLQDDEQRALLHKLWEWQTTEEVEMFTQEQLVEGGRLSPGLGLVVRRGSGEGVFVYVYHLDFLRRWVEQHNEDPLHQHLGVGDIFTIS